MIILVCHERKEEEVEVLKSTAQTSAEFLLIMCA